MKAYGLVLLCLQKKFFFAVGVARGDPIFAQVGPKNGIEVLANFFWNYWIPIKVININ